MGLILFIWNYIYTFYNSSLLKTDSNKRRKQYENRGKGTIVEHYICTIIDSFTAIGISRRCSASGSNWTRSTYIYTSFNWNSGWKELER